MVKQSVEIYNTQRVHWSLGYPTKAAMDAAIKKAKDEEERRNFQTNVKPQIDAGFRDINSTNNASGHRSINLTNNASTGFREIGESMNRYADKTTKTSAIAVSDKVMRGAKGVHDVVTDARVWKTVDDVANLSGKNVLLLPVDKSAQTMQQVVTDAAQQKAGYERGSAEDKAVRLAVSDFTGFVSGHVKQEISNKYFSGNKSPRLLINQTPKQEAKIWKENAARYLGVRGKAIDDVAWHGKNTPMTMSEYLEDLKLYADGKISKEEMNRREKNRWYNYFQRVVKQALSF